MRYKMIKEIKTETKVLKFIYLFDVIFLVAWIAVGVMLKNIVYTDLQIPFIIVHIIFGLIIRAGSPYNKQKKIYEAISFFLKKDKNTYSPISIPVSKKPLIKNYGEMYGEYSDLINKN